jgi:hypothetical protein
MGLVRGKRYRVIRELSDVQGSVHLVGEQWTYLGNSFDPYYAVRFLGIRHADGSEQQVVLDCLSHAIQHFNEYIAPLTE